MDADNKERRREKEKAIGGKGEKTEDSNPSQQK